MLSEQKIKDIEAFYATKDRWTRIQEFISIADTITKVDNIFFGDSITKNWPLHEFFPNHSIINRGLGGDALTGLLYRLQSNVLDYSPKKVFMMAGINGIDQPKDHTTDYLKTLATKIKEQNIEVFISSILPLRNPDKWDRFQYQDKIVEINAEMKEWAEKNISGFIDYHSVVKDETGQLAAECAQEDGTHLKFEAYRRMSKVAAGLLA